MTLSRTTFFLALFAIVVVPFVAYRMLWIFGSTETTGTMRFMGKDFYGQMPRQFPVIRFFVGKDTIWFHGADNVHFDKGQTVPVLYHKDNPSDALVNVFSCLWVDTLICATPLFLIILISFLHPELVPRRSTIQLLARRPFIRVI